MKRELLELKQKLMQRFLDGAIDQATYDRMLSEIDEMAEEEKDLPPQSAAPQTPMQTPASVPVQAPALPSFVTVLPAGAPMQMSSGYAVPAFYPGMVGPDGQPIPYPYGNFQGGAAVKEDALPAMITADKLEVRTATGVKAAKVWQDPDDPTLTPNPEIDPLVVKALKEGETLEVWWHYPLTAECVTAWKKIDVPLRLSLAMNESIDDEALQLLGQITNLHEINLTSTHVTDSGIKSLFRLTELESIILTSTEVTGESFGSLDGLTNLRELTLTSTPFSNAGMEFLPQFQNLDSLKLDDTNISDDGMPALQGLHQMQLLNLQGTIVSDAGLKYIAGMTSMLELYLGGTIPIDGNDYESPITDRGVEWLRDMTLLKVLHLNDTQVTDACLASLKKMTDLIEFNVTDTYFSDDSLRQLKRFENLQEVLVDGTLITERGIKKVFGIHAKEIFRGAQTSTMHKLGRFLAAPWSRKN